jgi:hypothetical protein
MHLKSNQIERLSMPDLDLSTMGFSSSDDGALTDEESMMKDYMGENYSFMGKVKTPKKLDVSHSTNLSQIPTNIGAIKTYTSYLAKEPKLGSNYFVKSGYCGSESVDECKDKQRWIYIRNIPSGKIPCTNVKTNMKGLLPGLLEDINDINPYEIIMNTMGKGATISSKCIRRTENVGTSNKSEKQTKCAPVAKRVSCMPSY